MGGGPPPGGRRSSEIEYPISEEMNSNRAHPCVRLARTRAKKVFVLYYSQPNRPANRDNQIVNIKDDLTPKLYRS